MLMHAVVVTCVHCHNTIWVFNGNGRKGGYNAGVFIIILGGDREILDTHF